MIKRKKVLLLKHHLTLYILPYYFYLVHVFYDFYLTKINLFISMPCPNQVNDKLFCVCVCVCVCVYVCVCVLCYAIKYFFPKMAFSSVLQVAPKNVFLVANHGGNPW